MITDWSSLPLVMHAPDMAALLGVSVQTIRRRCAAKRMYPAPLTWARPYVWARKTVQEDIESGVTALAPSRRPTLARPAPVRGTGAPMTARQILDAADRLHGRLTQDA